MNMKDLYITTNQNTKEQMFYNQLISGYNLAPIAAQALVELSRSVFASGEEEYRKLKPGQIKYFAISIDEPPGKPIKECEYIPVVLTLDTLEDMKIYKKYGLATWRRHVIRRICDEAYDQRAPLTIKDLVRIFKVSYSTIKRDIKELNKQHTVPTRGVVKDIGPTSHKMRIVEMYIHRYTPTEIERNMHHSLSSIERYIKDFARVAILTKRNESIDNIRLIVGISERLVREYQGLYNKYCKKHKEWIEEITSSIQIHEKAATFKKTEVVA
jgi:predicted transcriptional regulator